MVNLHKHWLRQTLLFYELFGVAHEKGFLLQVWTNGSAR
jgi:hypothetical protein